MKYIVLKRNRNKIRLDDIAMLLMVISLIALHDKSRIFMVTEISSSLVIYAYYFYQKHTIDIKVFQYCVWHLLFAFWAGCSIIWAVNESVVISGLISIIQVTMAGVSVLLYVKSEERLLKVLEYIVIACTILGLRLLISVPTSAWGSERVGNYIGYGNNGAANTFAYAAVFTFFLYKKSKKKYLFFMVMFVAFALLCGSRKAIVISILGIGMQMIVFSKNQIQLIKRIFLVIVLSCVFLWIIMKVPFFYTVLGRRVETMLLVVQGEEGGDSSTIDRVAFAKQAILTFSDHPILGVGLDNFRYYNVKQYYSHNNYTEIAADLGIIGLITYYWFRLGVLGTSIFNMLRKNKRTMENLFVLVSLLLILIMDVGNVSYYLDSIQFFFAILFAIAILDARKKPGVLNANIS